MPISIPSTFVVTSETRVNSFTTGSQATADVAVLGNGGHAVTWTSYDQDGSLSSAYIQFYNAAGNKVGGETRVNSYTNLTQGNSRIAALADGGCVVVWQSEWQDGSVWGVYGQRFDAAGNKVGGEFRIHNQTTDNQYEPSVTGLANGGFVVTYTQGLYNSSQADIYARVFDASGAPASADFLINQYTTSNQMGSRVAARPDGGFVVTWHSLSQDGSGWGVYARLYGAGGVPQSGEIAVNSFTSVDQVSPATAVLADGSFVVTWYSGNGMLAAQDGNYAGVYAQRFDAAGNRLGGEFRVNTYTVNNQYQPAVTALADGGFYIAWQSDGQDGSALGVYGQRYDASGNKVAGEVHIAETSLDNQYEATVAGRQDGGWVAAWTSSGQDGGSNGVYTRIYGDITVLSDA